MRWVIPRRTSSFDAEANVQEQRERQGRRGQQELRDEVLEKASGTAAGEPVEEATRTT